MGHAPGVVEVNNRYFNDVNMVNVYIMVNNIPVSMEKIYLGGSACIFIYPEWVMNNEMILESVKDIYISGLKGYRPHASSEDETEQQITVITINTYSYGYYLYNRDIKKSISDQDIANCNLFYPRKDKSGGN